MKVKFLFGVLILSLVSFPAFAARVYNYFPPQKDYNAEIAALATSNERKAESHFYQGLKLLRDKEYADATKEWIATLQYVPSHSRAKFYAELTYSRFQKVTRSYVLGEKAYSEGKYEEAVKYFNDIEKDSPKYKNTLEYLKQMVDKDNLNIIVTTASNGELRALPSSTLSIDFRTNLFAAGFLNGKFVDNIAMTWTLGSNLRISSADRTELFFEKAGSFGTIRVSFFEDSPTAEWESQPLTILPGQLASFQIFRKGEALPITTLECKVDSPPTLIAKGYDSFGNQLNAVTVEWIAIERSSAKKVDVTNRHLASEFTLPFRYVGGEYEIQARFRTNFIRLNDITLKAGKPSFITIEDKPKDGVEVTERTLLVDETIHLYAVLYDRNNNHIGLTNVIWTRTGTLPLYMPMNPTNSVTFTPDRGDKRGIFVISDPHNRKKVLDMTGEINVKTEEIIYLRIVNEQGIPYEEVPFYGETNFPFFAATFNLDGSFKKFSYAEWTLWKGDTRISSLPESRSFVLKTPSTDGLYKLKAYHNKQERYSVNLAVKAKVMESIQLYDNAGIRLPDNMSVGMDDSLTIRFKSANKTGKTIKNIIPSIDMQSNLKIVRRPDGSTLLTPLKPGPAKLVFSSINEDKILVRGEFTLQILPGKPDKIGIVINGKSENIHILSTNDNILVETWAMDQSGFRIATLSPNYSLNGKPIRSTDEIRPTILNQPSKKFSLKSEAMGKTSTVILEFPEKQIPESVKDKTNITPEFIPEIYEDTYLVEKNNILYEILTDQFFVRANFKELVPYMNELALLNRLSSPNRIYPGTTIRIPYVKVKTLTTKVAIVEHFQEKGRKVRVATPSNPASPLVRPGDKIILLDADFIRLGARYLE